MNIAPPIDMFLKSENQNLEGIDVNKMSKAIVLFIDTVAHLDNCIRLFFAFYINKHDMS